MFEAIVSESNQDGDGISWYLSTGNKLVYTGWFTHSDHDYYLGSEVSSMIDYIAITNQCVIYSTSNDFRSKLLHDIEDLPSKKEIMLYKLTNDPIYKQESYDFEDPSLFLENVWNCADDRIELLDILANGKCSKL